jgi:hypothetical protein
MLEVVPGRARAAPVGLASPSRPDGPSALRPALVLPWARIMGPSLRGACLGLPAAVGPGALSLRAAATGRALPAWGRPALRAGHAQRRGLYWLLGGGYRFAQPGNELP